MERREFLKTSCTFCVAVGAGAIITSLSSCGTSAAVFKTAVMENKIAVPASLFATGNVQLIRTKETEYDIALLKENETTYTALQMRCTHADNRLNSTGNGFTCNLHGSRFDNNGSVTKGPAQESLKKYKTEINSTNIIIYL